MSAAEPGPSGIHRVVDFVIAAATENWGTKIMAFLLALLVFIVTRDEVTRSFTVPLRVVEDPDRVLLTEPPATVELRLRGPWANVNRIAADELGPATLDLREVRPGPMALDPASVVMPRGVVLDDLEYDPVDLRFEAVIERGFPITPVVVGELDPDHELVATRTEPQRWPLRGPASALDELDALRTEAIDISGVRGDVDMRAELEPPELNEDVEFLGVARGELPTVRFVVEVEPITDEIERSVATGAALREALPEVDELELPQTERITVRGSRGALRELEGLDEPIVPRVEVDEPEARGAPLAVTLRFEWAEAVPEAVHAQLSIVPPLIRLRLSPGGAEPPGER